MLFWSWFRKEWYTMKDGIHPDYQTVTVRCACGNTFETGSTNKNGIKVEICSQCHPFFTGKQKLVDTGGRVDRFKKRYKLDWQIKKDASSAFFYFSVLCQYSLLQSFAQADTCCSFCNLTIFVQYSASENMKIVDNLCKTMQQLPQLSTIW